jgi:hypothetical protein
MVLFAGPASCKCEAFRQYWRGKGIFERPPVKAYPTKNRLIVYSSNLGGFFQDHLSALKLDDPVCPCVSSLDNLGRPFTILRRVGTVVILAVNGVLRCWPQSHILQENLKSCERTISKAPLIANVNPATSISRVIGPLRLMTSTPNIDPDSILGRPVHSMYSSYHDDNHPWSLDICQRVHAS